MSKVKYLVGAMLVCATTIGWQPSSKAEQKTALGNLYSEEFLTQVSKMMNSTLPMVVEEGVRWDSSYVGPGKTLNYNYTMLNYSASEIDGKMFANTIRPDLTNTICTTPETRLFPNNNVLLNFNYYGRDRNLITRVEVAPSDCK